MARIVDARRGVLADDRERTSLGLPELDHYLWGGLPRGQTALVIGGPFVGKETLAEMFLAAGLRDREYGLAILTDSSVAEWKSQITRHYPDASVDDPSKLAFVDLFPLAHGPDRPNVIDVPRPLTCQTAGAACREALAAMRAGDHWGRFIFDSMSTLVREDGLDNLCDELPPLMADVRASQASGLALVDEGVLDAVALRTLTRWFDGIIEMRRVGDEHVLRVEGLGMACPSPWIRYRYHKDGLAIDHTWGSGRIH